MFMLSSQLIVNMSDLQAQDMHDVDTSYYHTFPDQLITRFYFSRKFTGFHISEESIGDKVFKYQPNTTRNLGIGATYNWFTLNLAYGFDFMNNTEDRGNTSYLDLQSHLYLGQFNVDLFGQFYEGYYLKNGETPSGEPYIRPDLNVVEIGASVQYVFNYDKFSFKAAFQNSAYQKKSAGSWLLGWDIFYGDIDADSSLIPGYVEGDPPDFDRLFFFKTGPAGGYAYTLVMLEKFYLTGSLFLALNSGIYHLKSDDVDTREYFFSLDYGVRLAAGYNSRRWNIGGFFVFQEVQAEDNYRNIVTTGNFRVIVAYRWLKD